MLAMIVIQMEIKSLVKSLFPIIVLVMATVYPQNNIDGRFSISSFANYSEGFSNRNSLRLKPRLSFDAHHIANSKLSLTGYINADYRQYQNDDQYTNSKYLRVYNLAFLYDINKSTSLTVGRKINPKISNLGVIDGIQIDKSWNKISSGLVLGSRPDFNDFRLNLNLFETGVYFGFRKNSHQSIIAIMQQMNRKSIDRRSLYFTHFNRILDNFRYYFNTDIDLYKKIDGVSKSTFRLTGLYLSITYKPFKTLSLTTSYNSRKNIIYYATFKTYAEQLYDDATRKGLKMRINWKPMRYIYFGANTGYRLKTDDDRSSYNYSLYMGHSNIPKLHMLTRLTLSKITSNYLDGNIFDIYISKSLLKNYLTLSSNFKYIDYYYLNTDTSMIQRQISSDISWQTKNKLYFTLSYIGNFEGSFNYNQIYIIVGQRF